MDSETIRALIQKYKQQVESLNVVIRQLEAELDQPQAQGAQTLQIQVADAVSGSSKQKQPPSADPLGMVREWQFFNKSQPDGAEQLLELVGHPLSIGVLLEGLEKGGAKIGGKSAAEKRQNLSTVLARSGRFGRAARGTWGLPNWPHIKPVKRAEENGGVEPEAKATEESNATAIEEKPS